MVRLAEVVMKVLGMWGERRGASHRFRRQRGRRTSGLVTLTGDLVLIHGGQARLWSHARRLGLSEGEMLVVFPRHKLDTLVVGVSPPAHRSPEARPVAPAELL